jgi:hypothetical protein
MSRVSASHGIQLMDTDRPYSLWDRVHGVTVGAAFAEPAIVPGLWRAVGAELARLHAAVPLSTIRAAGSTRQRSAIRATR